MPITITHQECRDKSSVLLILTGVSLSIIAFFAIEKPLRLRGSVTRIKPTLGFTGAAILALVVPATWTVYANGIPGRMSHIQAVIEADSVLPKNFQTRHAVDINTTVLPVIGSNQQSKPNFLIWGDSHVYPLISVFDEVATEVGVAGYVCARNATAPVLGTWRPGYHGNNQEVVPWNNAVMELIREQNIQTVVMVCRWDVAVFGRPSGKLDTLMAPYPRRKATLRSSENTLHEHLRKTIKQLRRYDVDVILIAQSPTLNCHPNRVARLIGIPATGELALATAYSQERNHINSILCSVLGPGVRIIEPYCDSTSGADQGKSVFAPRSDSCIAKAIGFVAFQPLYVDTNHLTPLGARRYYGVQIHQTIRELGKSHVSLSQRARN